MPGTLFNFNEHPRRSIIKEMKHAKEQLELQSSYPGREPTPKLPQAEYSPWPSVDDKE